MFVINRLGQLSWHKMGQNLKLLQPWWNFSTAKSRKKKIKKNHVWKLTTKQSEEAQAGFMAAQHAGDREQWKRVLRGKKGFPSSQQGCTLLPFVGPRATLSRQPPVLLPRSSRSCSDHLLCKPKPVKTEFNCLGSRQWSRLPVIQGALTDGLRWQAEVHQGIFVLQSSPPPPLIFQGL